jgi:SAM-dependent methyltransferase
LRVAFLINGREFEEVTYPLPRADLEQIYWYLPYSKQVGFTCRSSIARNEVFAAGHVVLEIRDRRAPDTISRDSAFYYPDEKLDQIPLPDAVRMARVHGTVDSGTFRVVGYSTFVKLEQALQRCFGSGYVDYSSILDWGCGSARVTRYLGRAKGSKVTGVDIDEDNVQWCQRNLPFGRFETVPLRPPTRLRSGSFDLVLGISVFTHLTERDQFLWLEELHRIAAADAVLMMTCHGPTSVGLGRLTWRQFCAWRDRGFLDRGKSQLLGIKLQEADYYRDTYHSPNYVRTHWSRYFEIVDILHGYIGGHQDLVVMTPRRGSWT